ncbi:MAG: hypothetical protein U5S82_00765 [Gammaproteobacteria bacterium]|nr:hypothetical protein [Gammaproteobacteria bacterium]
MNAGFFPRSDPEAVDPEAETGPKAQAQIKELLRLADEPWVYIDEMQAHGAVMAGCERFMDRLLAFYRAWGDATVAVDLPPKQVFRQAGVRGDFRVMPCVLGDDGLKIVKVIGTNEEERQVRDKICVGKSLLVDPYDNHVYAVLDVCALSSFRTAAVSVLALRLCGAGGDPVGLVGMGRIGFYTACILHRWLGVDRILAADPDPRRRADFSALCAHYLPALAVEMLPLAAVTAASNALFLATTSEEPLVGADNGAHLGFVASVGADADNLSEVDATLLGSHRVVADSRDSMRLGDMRRWADAGLLKPGAVAELRDLAAAGPPTAPQWLFISTGIAVQDALVNRFVYEACAAPRGERA